MNRLRSAGTSKFAKLALPNVKSKVSNSWSAVQDTYFSMKDAFESHRVVFTIGTSIASVATAWAGYSLRYLHQAKVEQRLESIEQAMRDAHNVEHTEIRKVVNSGYISTSSCIATAGTTLVIGYGLGWKGGRWYAMRKFRREQLKSVGVNKIHKWQLLKRSMFSRSTTTSETKKLPVSDALHNNCAAYSSNQPGPHSC